MTPRGSLCCHTTYKYTRDEVLNKSGIESLYLQIHHSDALTRILKPQKVIIGSEGYGNLQGSRGLIQTSKWTIKSRGRKIALSSRPRRLRSGEIRLSHGDKLQQGDSAGFAWQKWMKKGSRERWRRGKRERRRQQKYISAKER